jgi:hypothetical protein
LANARRTERANHKTSKTEAKDKLSIGAAEVKLMRWTPKLIQKHNKINQDMLDGLETKSAITKILDYTKR